MHHVEGAGQRNRGIGGGRSGGGLPTRGSGPLLSISGVCARAQLKLFSLGLAHRLSHHNDDDNEHGEQDQDTTNRDGHHCAVTHADEEVGDRREKRSTGRARTHKHTCYP